MCAWPGGPGKEGNANKWRQAGACLKRGSWLSPRTSRMDGRSYDSGIGSNTLSSVLGSPNWCSLLEPHTNTDPGTLAIGGGGVCMLLCPAANASRRVEPLHNTRCIDVTARRAAMVCWRPVHSGKGMGLQQRGGCDERGRTLCVGSCSK